MLSKSSQPNAVQGVVLNPGQFASQGSCLPEFLATFPKHIPIIEVHYTNPAQRGIVSPVAPMCTATVWGFGVDRCVH